MSYRHVAYVRDTLAKPINSGFKVGAIAYDKDGNSFPAGNVEHENSPLSMCAERLALMNATMRGSRPHYLTIVSDSREPTMPCGVCRQYMSAFPKLKVTAWSNDGTKSITKTISQLFPNPFRRTK